MKLKNLFELTGLRQKPRKYRYKVEAFDIGLERPVKLAQWLHPKEKRKVITKEMVDGYRTVVGEGDFCIDIGAHTGDTTVPMALAAGPSGHVLAMEPNPYVLHVLQKNARINRGLTSIETLMAAATTGEQFIEFEYSDSGFCNGGRHENISPLTHGHAYKLCVFGINLADELRQDYDHWLDRLSFIKVDVEGYDLYVLKSIKDIIRDYQPVIKSEIFKHTDTSYRTEMFDFMSDLGYQIFLINEEPLGHDVEPMSRADMNAEDHFDILCRPTN